MSVPPAGDDTKHLTSVLGWCSEALAEGQAFVESQPGFHDFGKIIDYLSGEEPYNPRPTALSNIRDNRMGKIGLNLAAALTDIKPFWEFRTFNHRFDQQATMGNKLSTNWWLSRNIDLKWSDSIKHALAMGTGYSHLVFNRNTRDLDLIAEDPRDVLPVRPASNTSLQDAFGVIIRRERPVNYIKELYPNRAALVKPDRDASYAALRQQTRFSSLMNRLGLRSGFVENLYASLGGRPQAHLNVPTADLFTLYVNDSSRNNSASEILMGDPNTNWSYKVPPGGMLYPRKRCIVFTRTALLYDGPSIWWHGLFPVCKLTLDPWPWLWLGKSPLRDLLPLQAELDKTWRTVADHNERVGRPGLAADKNAVSQAAMNRIDTRRAGLKLRFNPTAGKPPQLLEEPALDRSIPETIKALIEEMEVLSGEKDVSQLMSLGQIPSAETVEKILEAMSPAVRLRSRVMEAFLREFAMMMLSNFFQFYTTAQRLAVLGPDGLTFEDFDYDPGTLIPDFVDDEDKARGRVRARDERARDFLRYFTFHVAPGSLLAASEITRKLLYLQLARMGYVDAVTLLEVLGIPNIGATGAPSTIVERLQWQQSIGLGMEVGPAGASAAGRKATAQQMPRLKVSESG